MMKYEKILLIGFRQKTNNRKGTKIEYILTSQKHTQVRTSSDLKHRRTVIQGRTKMTKYDILKAKFNLSFGKTLSKFHSTTHDKNRGMSSSVKRRVAKRSRLFTWFSLDLTEASSSAKFSSYSQISTKLTTWNNKAVAALTLTAVVDEEDALLAYKRQSVPY